MWTKAHFIQCQRRQFSLSIRPSHICSVHWLKRKLLFGKETTRSHCPVPHCVTGWIVAEPKKITAELLICSLVQHFMAIIHVNWWPGTNTVWVSHLMRTLPNPNALDAVSRGTWVGKHHSSKILQFLTWGDQWLTQVVLYNSSSSSSDCSIYVKCHS